MKGKTKRGHLFALVGLQTTYNLIYLVLSNSIDIVRDPRNWTCPQQNTEVDLELPCIIVNGYWQLSDILSLLCQIK